MPKDLVGGFESSDNNANILSGELASTQATNQSQQPQAVS